MSVSSYIWSMLSGDDGASASMKIVPPAAGMEEEGPCSDALLYYMHLVLLATLCSITVYRREMSCNRCYAESKDESELGRVAADKKAVGETTDWDDLQAECLLEGVTSYCSGASLSLWMDLVGEPLAQRKRLVNIDDAETSHRARDGCGLDEKLCLPSSTTNAGPCERLPSASMRRPEGPDLSLSNHSESSFWWAVPPDAQVHILSFLHPRDILRFASTSRSSRCLVGASRDGGVGSAPSPASVSLWKSVWERDYGWTVQSWSVGQQALQRSFDNAENSTAAQTLLSPPFTSFSRDFYFRFGLCFQNYALAGHNTLDSCLVGLDGHIYDLSSFVLDHPGSPETVMVHAGKESTAFFESIRHSLGARRQARSMCIVADTAVMASTRDSVVEAHRDGAEAPSHAIRWGLRPTANTELVTRGRTVPTVAPIVSPPCPRTAEQRAILPLESHSTNTLQSLRRRYLAEEEAFRRRTQHLAHLSVFGEYNVYYDPFLQRWKAWYTNEAIETVFVDP